MLIRRAPSASFSRGLRIVHVVRQYRPGIGGVEAFVSQLAEAQARQGHLVRVITLNRIVDGAQQKLPAYERLNGVDVIRIPYVGSTRYAVAPTVLRHLSDVDLVHVHRVDFFADFLAATRWLHHCPLVLSTHGGFFHTDFARRLKQWFFRTVTPRTLRGYAAVIASSEQDAALFSPIGGGKVLAVENGVDLQKFAGLARPGSRTMIYFGRFTRHKGVDRVIAWFASLHRRAPEWTLILAGRPAGLGPDEIGRMMADHGVASACELFVEPDDAVLRTLIARSSVYVCASSYEGFGIAAVEAVSAGLYPLLSPIPAFARTLDRVGCGMAIPFLPDEDVDRFLEDFARHERADGPTPAERVSSFGWDSVLAQINAVYVRALAAGPKDPPAQARQRLVSAGLMTPGTAPSISAGE
ncbi:glycosyltransferase family 4 protein [Sphingomonas aracearum]|nr:glycosyltransferase family 4 protein [Sphingomonas aracearum]